MCTESGAPITNSNLPASPLQQGRHYSSTDFAQCSAIVATSYWIFSSTGKSLSIATRSQPHAVASNQRGGLTRATHILHTLHHAFYVDLRHQHPEHSRPEPARLAPDPRPNSAQPQPRSPGGDVGSGAGDIGKGTGKGVGAQPRSPARTAAAVPLREQAKSPRAQAAARQDLSPWPSQRHHTVQPIKLKLEESGRAPDLDSETSARPGIKVRSGPNSCLDTSS